MTFESHAAFYTDVHGPCVHELRPAGRTGAVLIRAHQAAGDWSDAATPDLLMGRLAAGAVKVTMDLGGGRFHGVMVPTAVAIAPPGVPTVVLADAPQVIEMLAVPWKPLYELAGGDASGLPVDGNFGPLHESFVADRGMTRLRDRLWDETAAGNPHGALGADGLLLEIAATLLRLRDGGAPVPTRGLSPRQTREVLAYLDDNLGRDVSLGELAALTGLSTAYLCRAFRRATGIPPHRWFLQRKIDRARTLLRETDAPIARIAESVGFCEANRFSVVFRKIVGVTPTSYRRSS